MANVKTLQEKVVKATETVEKKKATIVRHEKQLVKKIDAVTKKGFVVTDEMLEKHDLSSIKWDVNNDNKSTDVYWEACEVESKLRDIKGATKNLNDAETILENWKTKLLVEIEKERFLNDDAPQVIKDFLQTWKENAYEWYVRRYDAYLDYCERLNAEVKEAHAELGIRDGMPPNRTQRIALEEQNLDWKSVDSRKRNFAGAIVLRMKTYRNEKERLTYLDNVLEQDKKFKMLDLINRINGVVGTITDASKLTITAGNINGIIVGETGKAKVETITAGGWNIQCWHYRTLVHKV